MAQPDPPFVEKLRIAVTDRCNHRCRYCMPEHGVPLVTHREVLRYEEIERIVSAMVRTASLRTVRLTGGEPLLRPGLDRLVDMLVRTGVDEVALTTNGSRLARHARALARAGLARVNLSLDTLDPERYRKVTVRGRLADALEGLDAAIEHGLAPVKLNCVVLRGVNLDELPRLVRFAHRKGVRLRLLEAMRIGQMCGPYGLRFVPLAEIIERLGRDFETELGPHPPGATSRPLRLRSADLQTEIGIIASESAPFCTGCARLRLTATGRLLACLLSDAGVDLRSWVRSSQPGLDAFRQLVQDTLGLKPRCRGPERSEFMSRIGG